MWDREPGWGLDKAVMGDSGVSSLAQHLSLSIWSSLLQLGFSCPVLTVGSVLVPTAGQLRPPLLSA